MTTDGRSPSGGLPPPSVPPSQADRSIDPPAALLSAAVSPDPAERSAELVARIRAEIEATPERRITFARYMERALYEPGLGYYSVAADRPTDRGDFLTGPETHAIFGRTIARRIEALWDELGRPRPFALIEYGAGSGTLALSILDGLRRHGAADLLAAIRYEPIESNPNRVADLRRRFEEAGLADRLVERPGEPAGALPMKGPPASDLTPTSSPSGTAGPVASGGTVPVAGVILANEFLDALPVHRVVVRGGALLELYVTVPNGGAPVGSGQGNAPFAEIAAFPSTDALAARLADDRVELDDGQVAEICLGLDAWLADAAGRLDRGFLLAIDYGYEAAELYSARRRAGTLLGYSGHRVEEDPFAAPGLIDLTAHVDFTAVERLSAAHDFRTVSLATQSSFLVDAGLEAELRALQAGPDLSLDDYFRARSGIVRLLDPRHMGRFRVLTLARGV